MREAVCPDLSPAAVVVLAARAEHIVQLCSWNAMCPPCIWLACIWRDGACFGAGEGIFKETEL